MTFQKIFSDSSQINSNFWLYRTRIITIELQISSKYRTTLFCHSLIKKQMSDFFKYLINLEWVNVDVGLVDCTWWIVLMTEEW